MIVCIVRPVHPFFSLGVKYKAWYINADIRQATERVAQLIRGQAFEIDQSVFQNDIAVRGL